MPQSETNLQLLDEGVEVELQAYTASHRRLSLRQRTPEGIAEIELIFCDTISLRSGWIAGTLTVTRHGEFDIRVSDGVLDVACAEAQRWHKWSSPDAPVLRLSRHTVA